MEIFRYWEHILVLYYDYERHWVISGEELDFRVKKIIPSDVMMISVSGTQMELS